MCSSVAENSQGREGSCSRTGQTSREKMPRETAVIIDAKGPPQNSCDQLTRYAKNMRRSITKNKRARLLLVAFRFEEACRKAASKAGIELFGCKLKLIREKAVKSKTDIISGWLTMPTVIADSSRWRSLSRTEIISVLDLLLFLESISACNQITQSQPYLQPCDTPLQI